MLLQCLRGGTVEAAGLRQALVALEFAQGVLGVLAHGAVRRACGVAQGVELLLRGAQRHAGGIGARSRCLRRCGTAVHAQASTAAQALALVPCLRPEALGGAMLETDARDLDVHALHQGFLRGMRRAGGVLQCNAELHLLHAYDLSPAFLAEAGTATAVCVDMLDELRQSLADAFATLAERYGVPAERRHFIMGPPIRTLAEFAAREGLDVLVMGRVQRKGLDKLLGSTTEHILYQVPCSILAVKA